MFQIKTDAQSTDRELYACLWKRYPPLFQVSSSLNHTGGLWSYLGSFKIDSQCSELLPEAVNICPSQGKPIRMLIHQSQGASEEAGAARCAGEPNQMNKPQRGTGQVRLTEGKMERKNQGSKWNSLESVIHLQEEQEGLWESPLQWHILTMLTRYQKETLPLYWLRD